MTVCFIVISIVTYAQSPDDLDNKNGFNVFKLGATISQVKKVASINAEHSPGKIKWYGVNNIAKYKVFGCAIEKIRLEFYDGLLLRIWFTLKNTGNFDNDFIRSLYVNKQMTKLYGEWAELNDPDVTKAQKAITGEKTGLYFNLYQEDDMPAPLNIYYYVNLPLARLALSEGNK